MKKLLIIVLILSVFCFCACSRNPVKEKKEYKNALVIVNNVYYEATTVYVEDGICYMVFETERATRYMVVKGDYTLVYTELKEQAE